MGLIKILNIENLQDGSKQDLLAFCDQHLVEGKGATLVPMNPIKVIKARKSPEFQSMIDEADYVFADASGIRLAAKILHGREIEICPGWQMMMALLEQCEEKNRSVYFLGTTDEILSKAKDELLKRYPKLQIAGMHHGFFDVNDASDLYDKISTTRPDYVFIAMGEYKQELVLEELRKRHAVAIFQGVGGSIDLLTGDQPMPPAWIRENHLEWLYRGIRQPFRLPRFKALPVFAMLVLLVKCRLRPNA